MNPIVLKTKISMFPNHDEFQGGWAGQDNLTVRELKEQRNIEEVKIVMTESEICCYLEPTQQKYRTKVLPNFQEVLKVWQPDSCFEVETSHLDKGMMFWTPSEDWPMCPKALKTIPEYPSSASLYVDNQALYTENGAVFLGMTVDDRFFYHPFEDRIKAVEVLHDSSDEKAYLREYL